MNALLLICLFVASIFVTVICTIMCIVLGCRIDH